MWKIKLKTQPIDLRVLRRYHREVRLGGDRDQILIEWYLIKSRNHNLTNIMIFKEFNQYDDSCICLIISLNRSIVVTIIMEVD